MKITAVICEFNPFHNGHKYILEKAREEAGEDGAVFAIMSGAFVQRGEGAIYPFHIRARAALLCGADAVLELPYPWSCSGARDFAFGAVSLAKGIGAEKIVFGSESGDTELLKRAAKNLSSDKFENALSERVLSDKSARYAEVREALYAEMYGEPLPISAIDTLGIEYIRSIGDGGITPVAYKRIQNSSASDIREDIYSDDAPFEKENMPDAVKSIFVHAKPFNRDAFSLAAISYLRLASINKKDLYGMPDGLLERIISASKIERELDGVIEKSKTKKYTNAAIRRAIIYALLSTTVQSVKSKPLFTRLIAANEKGREALSSVCFPIITRSSDIKNLSSDAREQLEIIKKADLLYSLCDENEKIFSPIII